jgi:predicted acetyltransferase
MTGAEAMETIPILHEPPAGMVLASGRVKLKFDKIVPADGRPGVVPYYRFQVQTTDGTEVGRISFRVGNTDHVKIIVGHIGYEIVEEHRGHGYALQACQAIVPFVRRFYTSVIITSDPGNLASVRTIERLGAVFLGEVPVPPDDPQYARGSRRKRRYEWKL